MDNYKLSQAGRARAELVALEELLTSCHIDSMTRESFPDWIEQQANTMGSWLYADSRRLIEIYNQE